MAERRLLLVGAGHAHLHLIARAEELRGAGYLVTLLAPRWFDYSGMAAAVATGAIPTSAARLDVASLAEGRVEHVQDTLASLDPLARNARTSDGRDLAWDVVSLNVGSVAVRPTWATSHDLVPIKPLSDLASLRERLAAARRTRPDGVTVTVIGAGASGLELAGHLSVHGDVRHVRLLEGGGSVGPGLPAGARLRAKQILARRGVEIRTSVRLADVGHDQVTEEDGTRHGHDVAVLAAGLTVPELVTRASWGGSDGVPVRSTLQHRSHDHLYAAGDCIEFLERLLPRVGVHGVRQGPVLLESLLAHRSGRPLPTYRPRRHALSILNLGGGAGIAVRGRWWWSGELPVRWKQRIDTRWLDTYRALGG